MEQTNPGASRGNPVILAAGEGRQFLSPGYDGTSAYSPETKCLWTFVPAPGTSLRFTCSKFSVTPMDPVGEKCRGESQKCMSVLEATLTRFFFQVTFCGFMTCPWEMISMTQENVIATLRAQISPTTLRSRFSSEATWTQW